MSNSRLLDKHLNSNICPDLSEGDRIVLIKMSDPISPVPPGTRGTVLTDGTSFMDETIYSIRWDKSGSLNILSNIDTLKKLNKQIDRSNDESEIERLKGVIKEIEKDHDVWMYEKDFDSLKKRVKNVNESTSRNVHNILSKHRKVFKNYELDKLIKFLVAVRDVSFINMTQASFTLICGKERLEHETKYANKSNKKAYQYMIDNADRVRDIMIRGAMETLEEKDLEITPESVERVMRRDSNKIMMLYISLPLKPNDYSDYDDYDNDEDEYEDDYDEEEDDEDY